MASGKGDGETSGEKETESGLASCKSDGETSGEKETESGLASGGEKKKRISADKESGLASGACGGEKKKRISADKEISSQNDDTLMSR